MINFWKEEVFFAFIPILTLCQAFIFDLSNLVFSDSQAISSFGSFLFFPFLLSRSFLNFLLSPIFSLIWFLKYLRRLRFPTVAIRLWSWRRRLETGQVNNLQILGISSAKSFDYFVSWVLCFFLCHRVQSKQVQPPILSRILFCN